MAIVVVGGHSRSVGKTSVVAGLIAALREYNWTALKITQYGHGICSADGQPCDCATNDHTWAVTEEKNWTGDSDSSRFLAAGAARAWWVRTEQGRLAEAMPTIRQRLAEAENVILESNSILKFLRPDIYLTVLDPATADFKKSAKEFLDRADGVILQGPKEGASKAAWQGISLKPLAGRPVFYIRPPEYVTAEMVEFVRGRLRAIAAS
ncbi:MAG TPA: hypothetical protein VMT28_10085 [Terriglobales bacterium]|jgi:hypothetical protein|nr:hypothetical protein [Terriglobales bacterium]